MTPLERRLAAGAAVAAGLAMVVTAPAGLEWLGLRVGIAAAAAAVVLFVGAQIMERQQMAAVRDAARAADVMPGPDRDARGCIDALADQVRRLDALADQSRRIDRARHVALSLVMAWAVATLALYATMGTGMPGWARAVLAAAVAAAVLVLPAVLARRARACAERQAAEAAAEARRVIGALEPGPGGGNGEDGPEGHR